MGFILSESSDWYLLMEKMCEEMQKCGSTLGSCKPDSFTPEIGEICLALFQGKYQRHVLQVTRSQISCGTFLFFTRFKPPQPPVESLQWISFNLAAENLYKIHTKICNLCLVCSAEGQMACPHRMAILYFIGNSEKVANFNLICCHFRSISPVSAIFTHTACMFLSNLFGI